jgi:hypothetical protein
LLQFSVARFLGDLAYFKGSELPVDRISIAKTQFFLNTNNVKDFLLQWRKTQGGLDPYIVSRLQRNSDFGLRMAIFRALGQE